MEAPTIATEIGKSKWRSADEAILAARAERDAVVNAVRHFHMFGQGYEFARTHPGAFEYCTQQPCLDVLKAYPDAVPADKRPDWLNGAASLARHDKKEK